MFPPTAPVMRLTIQLTNWFSIGYPLWVSKCSEIEACDSFYSRAQPQSTTNYRSGHTLWQAERKEEVDTSRSWRFDRRLWSAVACYRLPLAKLASPPIARSRSHREYVVTHVNVDVDVVVSVLMVGCAVGRERQELAI